MVFSFSISISRFFDCDSRLTRFTLEYLQLAHMDWRLSCPAALISQAGSQSVSQCCLATPFHHSVHPILDYASANSFDCALTLDTHSSHLFNC